MLYQNIPVPCPAQDLACPVPSAVPAPASCMEPQARGAAAASGGFLGVGTGARSSWLWLGAELEFEQAVSFISSVS